MSCSHRHPSMLSAFTFAVLNIMVQTFWDLSAKDAKGTELPMSTFRGNVVLVVNVASKCGFTGQYKDLQALYSKYKDQGLVVIGAPCNQFGGQEPGSEEAILEFCSRTYNVDFPILAKLEVNGPNTHPMYQWLKSQKKSMFMELVKWNFEKFLIGRDGQVIQRFVSSSGTAVLEPEIVKALAEQKSEL